MEYILTILGSLASVGSIPLAIYLYLRSREAKYSSLRREIVKILSYQIGEGRELSTFEVQAVIDSKIRENKLKPKSINVREIVEDLVAETISSPMLNSEQKAAIVDNLRKLHDRGRILQAIDRYGISYHQFLSGIMSNVKLITEDERLLLQEVSALNESEPVKEKSRAFRSASSTFGLLALVGTLVGTSLQFRGMLPPNRINELFSGKEILLGFLVGLVASIVAALLTYFVLKIVDPPTNQNKS